MANLIISISHIANHMHRLTALQLSRSTAAPPTRMTKLCLRQMRPLFAARALEANSKV